MPAVQNLFRMSLAWMASGRFVDLLSARNHTAYLTRHRLAALDARVRLVAVSFSVLTLAWIALDAAALDETCWPLLAVCRIVAAVVFILLALAPEREPNRVRALTMLAVMLAMPLMIYGVSAFLFAGVPLQGAAAVNGHLYRALPLVVLAGLCIFPLVASEGLAFALAIIAAVGVVQVFIAGTDTIELISNLWVLMLVLGVYLLACAIQLHYMMALLHRASYDPLTGAMTRRSGVEVLDLQFGLACDQDAPLSVLFIDADNFKSINDEFGHDAGDRALKDIVAKLHALLRQADVVVRWGGEEFVVILTNTPLTGAAVVIGRIVHDWLGKRPDGSPLTASIGLAELQSDGAEDWSQLIALADERMYVAKTSGKACCVNRDGVMKPSS